MKAAASPAPLADNAGEQRQPPPEKMPGHWLLASMGKRVLRPGGLELTRSLLDALAITAADDVVEFAPGLGITARMTLERNPRSYTAVERDCRAAAEVEQILLDRQRCRCVLGTAESTGLPAASATAVYGEAMLSMQPDAARKRIVAEAARLLSASGRYGIHELALVPDDIAPAIGAAIQNELSDEIHAGVRPLTVAEWRSLLESTGFRIDFQCLAPMHLLEPLRLIRDEGAFGAMRFIWNVARHPAAQSRVRAMRRVFRRYGAHLTAVAFVGTKLALKAASTPSPAVGAIVR